MKCTGIDWSSGTHREVTFDSIITGVDDLLSPAPSHIWVSPGWIDIQVNGFAGVDYNSPATTHEAIGRSIHAQFATGVTRFLPTVITGDPDQMLGSLKNLAEAKRSLPEGAAMEGFHVEGPHISPEDGPRGAHPREWVRPPDLGEYLRWQEATEGQVRLVTLAPEWPTAPTYIEHLVREGVTVSIGHTNANSAQIAEAISAGATLSTHLGNGAHAVLPRHPNYIWEQLGQDRLAASFIVDGIHLPGCYLKVALRAKGVDRSILITDAVMPAGCAPGPYRLGSVDVELMPDQRVVLRGGTRLAGSSLRIDRGIENLMRIAGLSLREAITMSTVNPARVCRIAGRRRGLSSGERADLVRFRLDDQHKIQVLETYLSGRLVYTAET